MIGSYKKQIYFEEPGIPESCIYSSGNGTSTLHSHQVYETNKNQGTIGEEPLATKHVCPLDEVGPNGQIPTNHGFLQEEVGSFHPVLCYRFSHLSCIDLSRHSPKIFHP